MYQLTKMYYRLKDVLKIGNLLFNHFKAYNIQFHLKKFAHFYMYNSGKVIYAKTVYQYKK